MSCHRPTPRLAWSLLPAVLVLAACSESSDPLAPPAASVSEVARPELSIAVSGASVSANAALPNVYLNTNYVAPTGKTVTVKAGGNLQAAIDAAQPGDQILIQAGASFTGPFYLRKKSGNGTIVIRTSTPDGAFPMPGQRATARHASLMPKLVGGLRNQSIILTQAGASNYRLIGLEIAPTAGVGTLNALIRFGDAAANQSTNMPSNLVLDRSYVHGNTTTNLARCVLLNSASTAIIESTLSECHAKGQDSQAIVGWNGSGPYKIVNNYLEGAGENVMFGGARPATPNLIPSDIEFRNNHVRKPASWKGGPWVIKNLLELKFARRVLIEGNLFEGNWQAGQSGYAINLKVGASMPWATTEDVTIRYNRIQNTGAGFSLLGADGSYMRTVQKLRRVAITHNILDSVNVGVFKGDAKFFKGLGGVSDVVLDHNTFMSTGVIANSMVFDQAPAITNFTMRNNVMIRGNYGIKGSGQTEGTNSFNRYTPNVSYSTNLLLGKSGGAYPATTLYSSLSAAGFQSTSTCQLSGSSPYAGKATDGTNLGADAAKVGSMLSKVIVP
jgi:hypothetical protein